MLTPMIFRWSIRWLLMSSNLLILSSLTARLSAYKWIIWATWVLIIPDKLLLMTHLHLFSCVIDLILICCVYIDVILCRLHHLLSVPDILIFAGAKRKSLIVTESLIWIMYIILDGLGGYFKPPGLPGLGISIGLIGIDHYLAILCFFVCAHS